MSRCPLDWDERPLSAPLTLSHSVSLCHAWVFGETMCRWYGIQGFVFGIASLLTTCLISVERCLKICSLKYGKSHLLV